jgi:hypothetical protein
MIAAGRVAGAGDQYIGQLPHRPTGQVWAFVRGASHVRNTQ